jgi:hypothetical protein
MVQGEEAFEEFLAGGGGNSVADAVVFGEGLDLNEVVAEVEIGPAVGGEDGFVQFAMELAEFEDALISGFIFGRFAADLGDDGRGEVSVVEEIVDVGQAKPEAEHEGAAMFVVVLANSCQTWVGCPP